MLPSGERQIYYAGRLTAQVARPILIDGRHVFSTEQARAAGWDYRGVGQG